MKPDIRPACANFSSGPCAKRPGWNVDVLANALLGRSHRSKPGKARLKGLLDKTRDILQLPDSHRIAIVPASDTGAFEMALWSLLGPRGVELLVWESFGKGWMTDVVSHLRLEDIRTTEADYGHLPDLSAVDFARDVVFCWNGTTSGVIAPQTDWIDSDRGGLTICDATSAAFAVPLPWNELDVTTFSWQKVLGGEAQHGMLILGPRAVERLEWFVPPWPLPKLFRMTKKGILNEGLFVGETINTPSMLCVEDFCDALDWADSIGGLPALTERVQRNASALDAWVQKSGWIDYLAVDPAFRSPTSVCLSITDPWYVQQSETAQRQLTKQLDGMLQDEGVAFDINGYRDAPPGLRIWCGATIETADLRALTLWLDWAWAALKDNVAKVA